MSTKPSEPSEEVKRLGFEKVAQVKIYQLFLLAEVINLASVRGAFKGAELSHVGALFDTLTGGVDRAFQMAKDELDKVNDIKLPSISEDDKSKDV